MNLTCHCRVYEAVLAVQRHSFPQKIAFLFTAFYTASLPPPRPPPDAAKLERERTRLCEFCTWPACLPLCQHLRPAQPWPWGAPWVGGCRSVQGAREQRQVEGPGPREGDRDCGRSAFPTQPSASR